MRHSTIKHLLAVSLVLVILLACGTAPAETFRLRTLERGVSLRSNPWVESDNKIEGIHANKILDAFGEVNGWYYVCYNGYWGYVAARDENGRALVSVIPSGNSFDGFNNSGNDGYEVEFSETDYSGTQIRTLNRGVSLRSDPWVGEGNKIDSIHANETLDVYGKTGRWYYVCYEGQWGYVASCDGNGNALVTVIPSFR